VGLARDIFGYGIFITGYLGDNLNPKLKLNDHKILIIRVHSIVFKKSYIYIYFLHIHLEKFFSK
jgi:hypothetical protein